MDTKGSTSDSLPLLIEQLRVSQDVNKRLHEELRRTSEELLQVAELTWGFLERRAGASGKRLTLKSHGLRPAAIPGGETDPR